MQKIRHDLRLAETITPFGVGAIVDVRGESLIAPDTSWWDTRSAPQVYCDRLVARLPGGVGVLRQPPTHAGKAAVETASLPYWRFPAWRFCERCSKLSQFTRAEKGKYVNTCECGGVLVPMRYVAVCQTGSHIRDIPWFSWAHRGNDSEMSDEVRFCKAYKELRFERSSKFGEGLASLRISCGKCKRSRALDLLVGTDSLLRDGIRCEGRQPWEAFGSVVPTCEAHLVAVQRGATGNYIAERISALDIPEEKPESVETVERVKAHAYYGRMIADNGGPQAEMIAGWIAEELDVAVAIVLAAASKDGDDIASPKMELKDGEWAAFVKKIAGGRDVPVGDFVVDGWSKGDLGTGPIELLDALAGVGQVRRVREVRALTGFRRHSAQGDVIRADLTQDPKHRPVYPAIELYGEGIFVQFDEARLAAWEIDPAVRARANILIDRRARSEWASRLDMPEPRYIALHTLSHLLIRRLAFASGYSSAALQERVYANSDRTDKTAGVLIYTAAGDAQGTLGGLVRLGHPGSLIPLIASALDDADVCSNDPVCIESDRQGSSQLNLSACHGCTLVSETSCESGNRLLDRQLVLGGSEVPGLLEAVLPALRKSAPIL